MQIRHLTHDDIDAAAVVSREPAGYEGRHVRRGVFDADPCGSHPAPAVSESQPRRLGFGILTRLARVDADSSAGAPMAGVLSGDAGAHRMAH
jgi:hypothetical protein